MLGAGLPCIMEGQTKLKNGLKRNILVVPCCLCYWNELKPLQPGELCRMNLQCSGNTHLSQPVISDLQIPSAHLLSSELKSAINTSDDFRRYSWRAKELNWTLQRKWFLILTQNCVGCPCECTSHHQILTNSNNFWLMTSRWVIWQWSSICVTETYILWVPERCRSTGQTPDLLLFFAFVRNKIFYLFVQVCALEAVSPWTAEPILKILHFFLALCCDDIGYLPWKVSRPGQMLFYWKWVCYILPKHWSVVLEWTASDKCKCQSLWLHSPCAHSWLTLFFLLILLLFII